MNGKVSLSDGNALRGLLGIDRQRLTMQLRKILCRLVEHDDGNGVKLRLLRGGDLL